MANICIASVCNRDCSYCFARPENGIPPFMSVDEFRRSLTFLIRSGIEQIRILGGEPTLHPDFDKILLLALRTRFDIQLFTNGFMPEKVLDFLSGIDSRRITVVMNATPFLSSNGNQAERPRAVMQKLARSMMLSVTLHKSDTNLAPLIGLIDDTSIRRVIRVGLALPRMNGENTWLRPARYRHTGARVTEFAVAASQRKIRISLDCGFIPCMFGEDGIRTLRRCDAELSWNCGPVLDIQPGGRILHCFPLSNVLSVAMNGQQNARAIREKFHEQSCSLRPTGIFRECARCRWRQKGECPGGCLAILLRRLKRPGRLKGL